MRAGDLVARAGGDEFVLLLPDIDAADARDLARRLSERARDPIDTPAGPVVSTVGIVLAVGAAG